MGNYKCSVICFCVLLANVYIFEFAVSELMRNLHVFCEFHCVFFYEINYKKCVLKISNGICIPDLKLLKKKKKKEILSTGIVNK